ncbi:MAG: carbohydrate-binding domain-containing protein [Oscillospiraceae bacterium]|nr:carbohydrate-binding domain-containing protein [Oscillospiraceae bacterium]
MKKKRICILLALCMAFTLAGCGGTGNSDAHEPSVQTSDETSTSKDTFADGDYKDVTNETPDATITLSGKTGTISDTTRGTSGREVTITSKGIYRVSGESDGVTIAINDTTESGNVYLILDGVTMVSADACIRIDACDKVIIQCVGDNTLTSTGLAGTVDGTIYARDDLTVNGSGTLTITSAAHGIVGNDDVKITGATVVIDASSAGIKAHNSVRIGGGDITISAGHDGVHVENDDGNGYFRMESGSLTISSGDDGIHAESTLSISGGEVTVSKSYEGLEALTVEISGGNISVTADDDGINAAGGSDTTSTEKNPWGSSTGTLTISGGNIYVNASGDGLDSNGSLYITGGTVIVEGPTNGGNGALDKGDGNGCVASVTGGTVLAIGTADMAINFDSGTQCAALVNLSGSAGDTITVSDGFTFTATKSFQCVVYSSPDLKEGNSYTLSAGNSSATADFSAGLYYSDVRGMGGGMMGGNMGGMMGGHMGGSPDRP